MITRNDNLNTFENAGCIHLVKTSLLVLFFNFNEDKLLVGDWTKLDDELDLGKLNWGFASTFDDKLDKDCLDEDLISLTVPIVEPKSQFDVTVPLLYVKQEITNQLLYLYFFDRPRLHLNDLTSNFGIGQSDLLKLRSF